MYFNTNGKVLLTPWNDWTQEELVVNPPWPATFGHSSLIVTFNLVCNSLL